MIISMTMEAMANYSKLYKVVNDNNSYVVIEKKTDHRIREFFSKKKAEQYAECLALGAGFNGFTPSFIVKKVL